MDAPVGCREGYFEAITDETWFWTGREPVPELKKDREVKVRVAALLSENCHEWEGNRAHGECVDERCGEERAMMEGCWCGWRCGERGR
jgi:hypothetical protein